MSGCQYVEPICLCDDLNSCTIDSCDSTIGCINVEINCDDNDDSTFDYCDSVAGCVHDDQQVVNPLLRD